MVHPSTLEGEEKLLYNQLKELSERASDEGSVGFSSFLNPREQQIAQLAVGSLGNYYGGFRGAQRQLLGVFPKHIISDNAAFPIKSVALLHKKSEKLDHRHVLGTIMNMGISRGSIGDILPEEGRCVLLCTPTAQKIFLDELVRIGSCGVSCQSHPLEGIEAVQEFQQVTGTISSIRLDNLVALLARTSRSKSADLFSSQKVQHNYVVTEKPTLSFDVGDTITIRGTGKFIVESIGKPTKKGRSPVECRKFT